MTRARAAAAAALVAFATGCAGWASDTDRPAPEGPLPVRVAAVGAAASDPAVRAGLADAERLLGARPAAVDDAFLVVAADGDEGARIARARPDAAVLVVGDAAPDGAPPNLTAALVDAGETAFLAGALAAVAAPGEIVAAAVSAGDARAAAFAAGARYAETGARPRAGGCAALVGAAVGWLPAGGCAGTPLAAAIGEWPLPGRRMVGLVGPRRAVTVFRAVRAVQDGSWEGGGTVRVGLDEEAIGFRRLSPALPAAAVDRLQHVEDDVRAGHAPVPEPPAGDVPTGGGGQ